MEDRARTLCYLGDWHQGGGREWGREGEGDRLPLKELKNTNIPLKTDW